MSEKMGSAKVTGRVIEVGKVETVGAKAHPKQIIALRFDEQSEYPREIAVEFFGKNVAKVGNVSVGDTITVSYDSKSRKSGDRWFSSHDGWRVETASNTRPGRNDGPPPDDTDIPF